MNTVQDKVDEFITGQKGFTSVDVCNAIKRDGVWIRNREVAAYLRGATMPVGYGVSRVTVELKDGDISQASVYLPNTLCVADYTDTAQEAMTPDEFTALHGFDPFVPQSVSSLTDTVNDDDDDDSKSTKDGGDGSHSSVAARLLQTKFNWPADSK
jgi:hypothetical protein